MDLEELLHDRADDAPSGENLEYDPTFMSLEIAATPGEERQVGDQTIPAEDPDFKEVSSLALQVLEQSHDLRAAVFLAQARLALSGLEEFAEVLEYMAGCLDRHWETCHPELDEDDGDPTMRVNAVRGLTDSSTILRQLRKAPLTESRAFGKLGLRDIMIANGEIAAPEGAENLPDSAAVGAAFQDTDDARLEAFLSAAKRADAAVVAIGGTFDEQVPADAPDLDPLRSVLRQIIGHLSEHADVPVEDAGGADEEAPEEGAAPVAAPVAAAAAPSVPGAINNTNDVLAAIDRIVEYYKRNEPSSPVPGLLNRARKLVNMDLIEILRDVSPDSVEELQRLFGVEDEEE